LKRKHSDQTSRAVRTRSQNEDKAMSNTTMSLRSVLAAVFGGALILITPIASANAKGRGGGNASIITSTDGGGGTRGPVVRDHRGEQDRTRPVRRPPPICAGWLC
jgi:hypothetical protein